ncbi:hypothetical protein ALQ18_03651 [Pseudomonas marginalis pv. marginalis]|nr:hypothetical protein ALQ18_03651 [Pseudomonas marginalis pv. marginalis]
MNELPGIRSFLSMYFPVFIGAILSSVFTLATALPLFFDSYFQHLPLADSAKYSFFGGLALTLVVVQCNFMIARGYPNWVRPLVALLALCVMGVVPTVTQGASPLVYAVTLQFPLLALLLLNSKRHREMRRKLLEVRHLRQAIIAAHKAG